MAIHRAHLRARFPVSRFRGDREAATASLAPRRTDGAATEGKSSGPAGHRARPPDWCRSGTDADFDATSHDCARSEAPPPGTETGRLATPGKLRESSGAALSS